MKIYISCDIEGIGGVPSWEFGSKKNPDYSIGRELMVGEVNAAVEGALDAGAKEIVVNDSHGDMVNLDPQKLHKAARLLQGEVKPWSMMEGMDKKYDAAAFIGYHAMAGTLFGSMCHTYCGAITEARVNGRIWGEAEINAAFCGAHKTPLVFVSGDEALSREIKKFIPDIFTAIVKKAHGMRAALSLHPDIARARIREGIKKAIDSRKRIKPFLPKKPYTLEVLLREPDMADICTRVPGTKRAGPRTIQFKSNNYIEVFRCFLCIMTLASRT
ncbi:M55 family metallopeptidase [Candidatus Sumerlaeota bacterium]|nr:M55 family metallopeptidase [Candidatus Sumerlaeota bacterium]